MAAAVFCAVYGIAAVLILSILTNWFRYGLSLEAMVVVVPLILGTLAIGFLTVRAFHNPASRAAFGIVVIAAMALALTLAAHRQAFGFWLPQFYSKHVESSGTATLRAHGRVFRYRLELWNPFARSHREVLFVTFDGTERRFFLPVFGESPGGYGSALEPSDWIMLRETSNPDILIAEIGKSLLVDRTFEINLRTGHAELRR
jgi:hypothetical protein